LKLQFPYRFRFRLAFADGKERCNLPLAAQPRAGGDSRFEGFKIEPLALLDAHTSLIARAPLLLSEK
jgi:hypothetical protein